MQVQGQPLPSDAPLVLPVLRELGVSAFVDELAGKQWDNGVSRGQASEVLVSCMLHPGRPLALYRVKEQVRDLGLDVVLGLDADQLHDDKLGDLLDALVPMGADGAPDESRVKALEQQCAHRAIEWLGIDPQAVLFDYTKLQLSGVYDESGLARQGRGSGSHKQLQLSLNVLAETGVPVSSRVVAGNANQTVNVPANLAELQSRLPGKKLVVVSDSAGLSHENIMAYNAAHMGFISPKQLTAQEDAWMRAPANSRFEELSYQPESGATFSGLEATWTLRRELHKAVLDVRVLIVRSSALRRSERRKLTSAVRRLRERLDQIHSHLNRNRYYHAGFAREQLQKAVDKSDAGRFVSWQLSGESGALSLDYSVDYSALIDTCRRLGRYVLFTNTSPEQYDADALLRTYKCQHQVEAGFAQLKSELHVAPLMMKRENRIVAIAALYVLALMVIAILQFLARRAGLTTKRGRPMTGRELLVTFGGWTGVRIRTDHGDYVAPNPASELQQHLLDALGLPPPQTWIAEQHRPTGDCPIPGM
jgi:hypothetical protein